MLLNFITSSIIVVFWDAKTINRGQVNIHSAAIIKNNVIMQLNFGLQRVLFWCHLDEAFPNFSSIKYENLKCFLLLSEDWNFFYKPVSAKLRGIVPHPLRFFYESLIKIIKIHHLVYDSVSAEKIVVKFERQRDFLEVFNTY